MSVNVPKELHKVLDGSSCFASMQAQLASATVLFAENSRSWHITSKCWCGVASKLEHQQFFVFSTGLESKCSIIGFPFSTSDGDSMVQKSDVSAMAISGGDMVMVYHLFPHTVCLFGHPASSTSGIGMGYRWMETEGWKKMEGSRKHLRGGTRKVDKQERNRRKNEGERAGKKA